jgi:folate-binding protein YgfZ
MSIEQLRQIQHQLGAIFADDQTTILSFGNDHQALKAVETGVALYDRSHWGLLQLKGDERQQFLHNQTTNNINNLKPGQGCDTVFVTSTGRTIDLASVYLTHDSIKILVSPTRRHHLIQWIDRFIFPMDKVELRDLSQQNTVFTLLGSGSDHILHKLGLDEIIAQPQGNHIIGKIGESLVRVAVGSGLTIPGYTIIVSLQAAQAVWEKLAKAGAILLGDRVWEHLRILNGRPMAGQELTEDYNPLEAGLWKTISFNKGCYIGQETIARLNTYKGVKQRLWGIKLLQEVTANTEVMLAGNKVGVITSCTPTENGAFALGYIKTKAGGLGLRVQVEQQTGEVVSVPFLIHEYYQPN